MNDEWRRRAGWHNAQKRLCDGRDLRDAGLDFRAFMKENLNDGNTIIRLRFDMLDVVDRRGHGAFTDRDKALFHFLGRDACIAPDHANNRNIDVRKNIRGHSCDRDPPDQYDQNGHYREAVWPPQSQANNPHTMNSNGIGRSAPAGRVGAPSRPDAAVRRRYRRGFHSCVAVR